MTELQVFSNEQANISSSYAEDLNYYADEPNSYAEDLNYYAEDPNYYAGSFSSYAEDLNYYADDPNYYAGSFSSYAKDLNYYADGFLGFAFKRFDGKKNLLIAPELRPHPRPLSSKRGEGWQWVVLV